MEFKYLLLKNVRYLEVNICNNDTCLGFNCVIFGELFSISGSVLSAIIWEYPIPSRVFRQGNLEREVAMYIRKQKFPLGVKENKVTKS